MPCSGLHARALIEIAPWSAALHCTMRIRSLTRCQHYSAKAIFTPTEHLVRENYLMASAVLVTVQRNNRFAILSRHNLR